MKTITVEPLTRLEGHGRVELRVHDGRLQSVRLALDEAPRLFEGLLPGRDFAEVPALVCRICSICTAVHRIAAASALEQALGLSIPPLAAQLRELLLLGGHLSSHALHLFCLILPDLRGVESLLPLLAQGDPGAKAGLELKGLANRIQEIAGGRAIHPINVEVGGMMTLPPRPALEDLLRDLEVWPEKLAELLEPFNAAVYPPATPALGTRLSVHTGPYFGLQGDTLVLSDGRIVAANGYAGLLAEQRVPWSQAKQTSGGLFLTGALARAENHARCNGAALPVEAAGIHANNAAQGQELRWAIERCCVLLAELLAASPDEPLRVLSQAMAGVGTTVIEAPRGLLVHHYVLDDQGRVVVADIVTPTAINQRAIEAQLRADLIDTPVADLAEAAQRIVRAYDPCISCAVHLLMV